MRPCLKPQYAILPLKHITFSNTCAHADSSSLSPSPTRYPPSPPAIPPLHPLSPLSTRYPPSPPAIPPSPPAIPPLHPLSPLSTRYPPLSTYYHPPPPPPPPPSSPPFAPPTIPPPPLSLSPLPSHPEGFLFSCLSGCGRDFCYTCGLRVCWLCVDYQPSTIGLEFDMKCCCVAVT